MVKTACALGYWQGHGRHSAVTTGQAESDARAMGTPDTTACPCWSILVRLCTVLALEIGAAAEAAFARGREDEAIDVYERELTSSLAEPYI